MASFKGPIMVITLNDSYILEIQRSTSGDDVGIGTNFDMGQKLGRNDVIPKSFPISIISCGALAEFLFSNLQLYHGAVQTTYNGTTQKFDGISKRNCEEIAHDFRAYINAI